MVAMLAAMIMMERNAARTTGVIKLRNVLKMRRNAAQLLDTHMLDLPKNIMMTNTAALLEALIIH